MRRKGVSAKGQSTAASRVIKIDSGAVKGKRGAQVQGRSIVGEIITHDLETPFTVAAAVYL